MTLKKYHYDDNFGKYIRERRMNKEISLRKFAELVGISPVYMSKIETGDYSPPAEDKIKSIAKYLGIPSDYLLKLAGKIDSELYNIILNNKTAPEFLRKKYNKDE